LALNFTNLNRVKFKMAGVMDEFDEATPLKSTYCSKLSQEQYEDQTALSTQRALEQLIQHLESNPGDFGKVVKARKQEEAEESGVFSYLKVTGGTNWICFSLYLMSYNLIN